MLDTVRPKSANRFAFFLLCGIVACVPLPFGSSTPSAAAFWCVALGLCLLLASPVRLEPGHWIVLIGVLIVVTAYAFVLHEQLADRPWIANFDPSWSRAASSIEFGIYPSA